MTKSSKVKSVNHLEPPIGGKIKDHKKINGGY